MNTRMRITELQKSPMITFVRRKNESPLGLDASPVFEDDDDDIMPLKQEVADILPSDEEEEEEVVKTLAPVEDIQTPISLNLSFIRRITNKNPTLCFDGNVDMLSKEIPLSVHGDILSVIGSGNLIISGKLKQFRLLIEEYEFSDDRKKPTLLDLQGFWDVLYLQVEQIYSSFENLDKIQENDFQAITKTPKVVAKVKKTRVNKKPVSKKLNTRSNFRDFLKKKREAEVEEVKDEDVKDEVVKQEDHIQPPKRRKRK